MRHASVAGGHSGAVTVARPWHFASALIPRSLGTRLALTYTGLALLIMAGLGFSLAGTIRGFFIDRQRTELLQESIVAGDVIAPLIANGADREALAASSGATLGGACARGSRS